MQPPPPSRLIRHPQRCAFQRHPGPTPAARRAGMTSFALAGSALSPNITRIGYGPSGSVINPRRPAPLALHLAGQPPVDHPPLAPDDQSGSDLSHPCRCPRPFQKRKQESPRPDLDDLRLASVVMAPAHAVAADPMLPPAYRAYLGPRNLARRCLHRHRQLLSPTVAPCETTPHTSAATTTATTRTFFIPPRTHNPIPFICPQISPPEAPEPVGRRPEARQGVFARQRSIQQPPPTKANAR
jgi:hypothetical protein